MFRSPSLLRLVCFGHLAAALALAGCTTEFDTSRFRDVAAADASDGSMVEGGMDATMDGPPNDTTADVVDGGTDVPEGGDAGCPPCGTGETCCGNTCVDLMVTGDHCGTCARACPGTACVAGQCLSSCVIPFVDCDGNVINGCEINAATDAMNCGACGRACAASQVCDNGSCACAMDRGDCDGDRANGCETDTATDALNCGACNHACGAGQACVAGACACSPGFADCDANPMNGCEIETTSDSLHCGACGNACGVHAVCMGGACQCNAGFLSCGATFACTTAASDPANCGMCGTACSGTTPVCGSTGCSNGCAGGEAMCGTSCVDTMTDVNNCGVCGTTCTAPAGSSIATCDAGVCGVRCQTGFADCNGLVADGCEVDARTDAANCGACGNACGGSQICVAGVCGCPAGMRNCGGVCAVCCTNNDCNDGDACTSDVCTGGTCTSAACAAGTTCCGASGCNACCSDADCMSGAMAGLHRGCAANFTCTACAPGFADCDGNPINGCEADLSSPTTCGTCQTACSFPNAGATCANGACALGACSGGFGNCDGNASNGCETNLSSSNTSCGACGVPCNAVGNSCVGGACVTNTCPPGLADCDHSAANGCEINLVIDRANCGGCGTMCALANATSICASSMCAIGSCNAGFGDCDSNPSNGCESNLNTDVNHCGGCSIPRCSFPHAGASCNAGACTLGACNPGFGNCDGVASNGCETDLTTTQNCGTCGSTCEVPRNASAVCVAGACRYACNAGSVDCNMQIGDGCEVRNGTDPLNCGLCGVQCPAIANAATSCVGGSCGFDCNAGFANCDGNRANGCEVNVVGNAANCGRCGFACHGAPHATGVCTQASGQPACALQCDAGWSNCDGNAANGCETPTASDPAHCGSCSNACNALQACNNGSCGACLNNCGGHCVDTQTDRSYCGNCNTACGPSEACVAGVCRSTACTGTQTSCAGRCTSLQSDPANCGACGVACGPSQTCIAGRCAAYSDECARALAVSLPSGEAVFDVSMSQFTDSSVCSSGGDAFLQINLAQAEVVYVDTFRSPSGAPLAQLSFIDSCGQSTTCASNACAGTGNGAGQSQIVRWLTAGTHYLVVDAPTSTSTPVRVTIQHFPATSANGMALMNPGDFNISGTTTGGSQSLATCGAGPDQTYFWTTCPSSQGGAFNASLCSGASFDTVLQQLNGNGMFGGCNNNDFYCSPQSSISVSVPGGAGLHAFIVDGASSSSAGAFTAQVTRP